VSRYRHVSAMKAEGFPVAAACEAAEVSTSAFYDWLARSGGPTLAEWDEALVVNEIHMCVLTEPRDLRSVNLAFGDQRKPR